MATTCGVVLQLCGILQHLLDVWIQRINDSSSGCSSGVSCRPNRRRSTCQHRCRRHVWCDWTELRHSWCEDDRSPCWYWRGRKYCRHSRGGGRRRCYKPSAAFCNSSQFSVTARHWLSNLNSNNTKLHSMTQVQLFCWTTWPWPADVIRPHRPSTLCRIVTERALNVAENLGGYLSCA